MEQDDVPMAPGSQTRPSLPHNDGPPYSITTPTTQLLSGTPSDWKQARFAFSALQSYIDKPLDNEMTLSLYTSPTKPGGMEINYMPVTINDETDALSAIEGVKWTRLILNDEVISQGHWQDDRLEREIKLATKTLEDWAACGGKVFGEVYVLVGGGAVRTFLKRGLRHAPSQRRCGWQRRAVAVTKNQAHYWCFPSYLSMEIELVIDPRVLSQDVTDVPTTIASSKAPASHRKP